MTIQQAKEDINTLQNSIKNLLTEFEQKYGEDSILSIGLRRYNGSNDYFGKIVEVKINTQII